MDNFFPKFLDDLFRRHAIWMWAAALLLGIVACWIMIGAGGAVLVYEGF